MNLGYLDAGTGSLILQTVLGGVAGAAVLFTTLRNRIFKRKSHTVEQAAEEAAPPAEQSTES